MFLYNTKQLVIKERELLKVRSKHKIIMIIVQLWIDVSFHFEHIYSFDPETNVYSLS